MSFLVSTPFNRVQNHATKCLQCPSFHLSKTTSTDILSSFPQYVSHQYFSTYKHFVFCHFFYDHTSILTYSFRFFFVVPLKPNIHHHKAVRQSNKPMNIFQQYFYSIDRYPHSHTDDPTKPMCYQHKVNQQWLL